MLGQQKVSPTVATLLAARVARRSKYWPALRAGGPASLLSGPTGLSATCLGIQPAIGARDGLELQPSLPWHAEGWWFWRCPQSSPAPRKIPALRAASQSAQPASPAAVGPWPRVAPSCSPQGCSRLCSMMGRPYQPSGEASKILYFCHFAGLAWLVAAESTARPRSANAAASLRQQSEASLGRDLALLPSAKRARPGCRASGPGF